MTKKYIYSDKVWINRELRPATICILNDKIDAIIDEKRRDAIDYTGFVIIPGVIDAHVHINEPGRTSWEGFNTATRAAAFGGTTTLVDMPLNANPVTTNIANFQEKLDATKSKLHVNCGFWGGAIGQEVKDVKALLDAGCLGIKVFLSHSGLDDFPNIIEEDLDLLMRELKDSNVPILAHCELDTLPAVNTMPEDPRSYQRYLASRPRTWENEAVKLFLGLSKKYNCRAHVVHLVSEEIIPWIEEQMAASAPVSVETCAHYLFFDRDMIDDGDTLLKCAPPIRESTSKKGLIEAIKNKTISFITSDHSPAPPKLKEIESGDFAKAWGGISGLQFLLPASWTALRQKMSIEDFIPLLTENPAKFIGKSNTIGYIETGYQADLCIWDPNVTFIVTKEIIQHKHKLTPYMGHELYGKVHATFVNGECVMHNDKMQALNSGQLILK